MAIYDNPDDWFTGKIKRTKKSKGAGGGFTPETNRPVIKNVKAATLNAITATNKKLPQVMVKISGASKGTDKAQAHVNYIGRKGEVEVENQDGEKVKGAEQKKLLEAWEAIGIHTEDKTGKRKEAFHFVFSMPSGTNPDGLKSAVRNLVNEEFSGHKYFMAQHLDTDSPHVHVLVCATDDRGARLNPRKADLHNYRVQFVHKLAEQGIEATASRRLHRFKYKEGKTQSQIHKEAREGSSASGSQKPLTSESKKKIDATHKEIADQYKNYKNALPETEIKLKNELEKLVKSQDKEKERGR